MIASILCSKWIEFKGIDYISWIEAYSILLRPIKILDVGYGRKIKKNWIMTKWIGFGIHMSKCMYCITAIQIVFQFIWNVFSKIEVRDFWHMWWQLCRTTIMSPPYENMSQNHYHKKWTLSKLSSREKQFSQVYLYFPNPEYILPLPLSIQAFLKLLMCLVIYLMGVPWGPTEIRVSR